MTQIKRHNMYRSLALLIGLSFILSSLAYAQSKSKLSTEEFIAIAFYKTGKTIPNFGSWVTQTSPYINTAAAQRPKIFAREMERLKKGYVEFDPKEDIILVQTTSSIDLEKLENEQYESTYYATAKFKQLPDAMYFPYTYLGERFSVMPYNLNKSMVQEIDENTYTKMSLTGAHKEDLKTYIRMKPIQSDMSQPHYIDGFEQWVLKTYVVSIEYRNQNGTLVWEYAGEGYSTEIKKNIDNLFSDRPYGNKKGNVKPASTLPK